MPKYAERIQDAKGSPIRALAKYMQDPELVSLGGGNPSPDTFPINYLSSFADRVLKEKGGRILQYGPTEGLPEFKESVLEHLIRPRGVYAEIDNILSLTGSVQGFDLVSKVFIDKGDVVLAESASFIGCLQAFRMMQAEIIGVEMDDYGVILSDLEEKMKKYHPKLFYSIPTFQKPTGKTLPADRRQAVAELAKKYDVIVLEDDPYCDLRYRGKPMPTIKSFDDGGEHVVLFNSFSKILAPGLRLGVAVGPESIISRMGLAKQSSVGFPNGLAEAVADAFLREGLLPAQIASITPKYKIRCDFLATIVTKYFPEGTKYVLPDGGMFLWVELPGDPSSYDMNEIRMRALTELKVAITSGVDFSTIPNGYKNCMRLCFTTAPLEKMEEAVYKLGNMLKKDYC